MTRYVIENKGISVSTQRLYFRGLGLNNVVPRWGPNPDYAETFPSKEAAVAFASAKMPHATYCVVPLERG